MGTLVSSCGCSGNMDQDRAGKEMNDKKDLLATRVLVVGALFFVLLFWSSVIVIVLRALSKIDAITISNRQSFMTGLLAGIICTLIATHREEMKKFLD